MRALALAGGCRVQGRPITGSVLATHGAVCAALALVGAAAVALDIDPESALVAAPLSFVGVCLWTFWSWHKVRGTIFDPYALFLASSWSFNGAQVVLEVMQLNERGLLGGVFSAPTLLRTEYLVALAICAMHFGALWAASGGTRPLVRGSALSGDLSWHTRWVGWFLLAVSIGPAVRVFEQAGQAVMAGGYISLYQRSLGTGFETTPRLLANFLAPSALFLLAGSKSRRTGIVVSAAIIVCYSASMFFLGARAAATTALTAYLWLFSQTVRKIRIKALLVPALALVFVVFPLVRSVRETRGSGRISIESAQTAWSAIENPAVAALSEIGSSMSTVAYTLDLVPSIRPFDLGVSYLYALLAAIPNVAWDIHPTAAHGTLSVWLVRTVQPSTAAIGGGLGYSFIAEAYENFGWLGAPLALLALGWAAGRVTSARDARRDPAFLAMTATLLSSALIFARAEAADFVRNACWYSLAPFLLVRFLSGVRR